MKSSDLIITITPPPHVFIIYRAISYKNRPLSSDDDQRSSSSSDDVAQPGTA